MDTLQVRRYFENNKLSRNIFKGVLPVDFLDNEPIYKQAAYIVNTGKSDTIGEHWFALLIPKYGPIEYFDSYGMKPFNREVYEFVKRHRRKLIFNRKRIQSNKSYNCGKFSVFYLYFR